MTGRVVVKYAHWERNEYKYSQEGKWMGTQRRCK